MQITANGKSLVSIRLPRDCDEVEQFAAAELARYMGMMSKAHFSVVPEIMPENISNRATIHIGRTETAREITSTASQLRADGYVIRNSGDNLFIVGSNPRGTLFGVYCLLEEFGCRFLAPNFEFYPDGYAEIIPRIATLAVGNVDIIEEPAFAVRRKDVSSGWTHDDDGCKAIIDWMAKNRMNTFSFAFNQNGYGQLCWADHSVTLAPELKKRGMELAVGQHGYESWLPAHKYASEHPEWFALKAGKRRSDCHASLCDSSVDALDKITNQILCYLAEHPEIDILELWPPDDSECWCECEQCKSLGIIISDRHIRVVNHVAKAVERKFPGKIVEFPAYQDYTVIPKLEVPHGNTRVAFCSYGQSFRVPIFDESDAINRTYWQQLLNWREKYPNLPVYIYAYYRMYPLKSLPVLLPELIAAEMVGYRKISAVGIGCYSEPGDWRTYEIMHWLVARLSWNPNEDIETVFSIYLTARYGNSASVVRDAVRRGEQLWQTVYNTIGVHDHVSSLDHAERLVSGFGEVAADLNAAGAGMLSRSFVYAQTYFEMHRAAWAGDAGAYGMAVHAIHKEIWTGVLERRIIPHKHMCESIVDVARKRLHDEMHS